MGSGCHRLPGGELAIMFLRLLLLYATVVCAVSDAVAADKTNSLNHLLVSFKSGNKMLLGYLFRPEGKGPFPGIIFHHSNHQSLMDHDVTEWKDVASLFTSHGYIFFLPDRHSDSWEKSEFSPALQALKSKKGDSGAKTVQTIERQDILHQDVVAALEWFKEQPEVDATRIAMGGQGGGAVQSLYEVQSLKHIQAIVAFSPAIMSWTADPVIRGVLTASVRKSTVPLFIAYTRNQNQAAIEALGQEMQQKGAPNEFKLYPAPNSDGKNKENFVYDRCAEWGPDVFKFLQQVMATRTDEKARN